MANNIYGAIALTGGEAGALDKIDGVDLNDGDAAVVITQDGNSYFYTLDATSGLAESSPDVIAPDTNAGDKRWILAKRIHEWEETPSGVVDGVNTVFTLTKNPKPLNSLLLFLNGVKLREGAGNDYTLSGKTITFESGMIPETGDLLIANYTI